ncbi:PREDICTED: B3 domain-containing protein At3g25182-like [Tarenaya hassleriana]|uniref:B3 domain-containing protein At3g25182-like n=1 Tax=Tarenaya hassleriana TaxID=28532 RepID=UPI00053C0DC8|nr:PREDICTED: B3 domain-containing protein At3g25182-like [Tarenaya hassleriana]
MANGGKFEALVDLAVMEFRLLLLANAAATMDQKSDGLRTLRFDRIWKCYVPTGRRSSRRRRTDFANLIIRPDTSPSSLSNPMAVNDDDEEEDRNSANKRKRVRSVEEEIPVENDDSPSSSSSSSLHPVRETPAWIADAMQRMKGQDARLVTEKTLTASDVNRGLSRLLIPFTAIVDEDFLTEEERRWMDQRYEENRRKAYAGFEVEKKWNKVVEANGFMEGEVLQLWSFRVQGKLYLAVFIIN